MTLSWKQCKEEKTSKYQYVLAFLVKKNVRMHKDKDEMVWDV